MSPVKHSKVQRTCNLFIIFTLYDADVWTESCEWIVSNQWRCTCQRTQQGRLPHIGKSNLHINIQTEQCYTIQTKAL